jgi:hypothetical protein
MTVFNRAELPDNIVTIEQLVAYGSLALMAMNPNVAAIEGVGISQRAAQAGTFFIDADGKHRLLCRVSLEISPDYLAGGKQTWTYVQPLSENLLPANFIKAV